MYFSQNGQYLPGFTENATLPFVPGKTYRLRVINMSALAMFWFWIDGHQLRVIEVDGVSVQLLFLAFNTDDAVGLTDGYQGDTR